jgi:hypothetical protein
LQVFEPHNNQEDIFEEISQLAQSVTDGYNVCIFAYGQTGSGKSFTMEGGSVSGNITIKAKTYRLILELGSCDSRYDPPGRRAAFPCNRRVEGQRLGIYS